MALVAILLIATVYVLIKEAFLWTTKKVDKPKLKKEIWDTIIELFSAVLFPFAFVYTLVKKLLSKKK